MRARSRCGWARGDGGRAATRAVTIGALAAVVALGGAATANARLVRADRPPSPAGDSTAFVHQIQWTSSSPAPGVTLLSGAYRDPSASPYWTVTIQAPAQSPFDGSAETAEAGSVTWAKQIAATLTADGFVPIATVLPWPRYGNDPRGVMGVRVRVGRLATEADADADASTLTADGFQPLVEWTGYDPEPGPDAELAHVAIVDPWRFAGQVIADHGSAIAGRQTVPAASAALGSLAATNGGFFTIDAPLAAVNGVATGLSVYDGQIESLANGDRAALVLDGRRPARIENLSSRATLQRGGQLGGDPRNQPTARQRRGLRRRRLCADQRAAPEHAVHRRRRHGAVHPAVRSAAAARAQLGARRAGGLRCAGTGRLGRRPGRSAAGR